MHSRIAVVLLAQALLSTACAQAGPVPVPAQSTRLETGRSVYVQACAHCHDVGVDGAPVTGRAQDWQQRSQLWQSVLFEHADKGYLKMPARGGEPGLGDADVAAAAEYMLTQSHPHVPAD